MGDAPAKEIYRFELIGGEMRKLVSFIVPAYNEESGLARCLNSIIDYNKDDVEIIVIDDGSTDKTYSTPPRWAPSS